MATLKDYNTNIIYLVPCLVEDALKELSDMTMDLVTKKEIKGARDNVLKRGSATLLLIGANHGRYGTMKNQIQQNFLMGINNYTILINETVNILNTFAKTNKTNYGKKEQL